jgi:hypothetical protein
MRPWARTWARVMCVSHRACMQVRRADVRGKRERPRRRADVDGGEKGCGMHGRRPVVVANTELE